MSDPVFPAPLIDLQKRSTAAWDAVEAHRKQVDEARRREADASGARRDELRPWASVPLRDWTDAEDAEHERLLAAARSAAQALRTGIRDAGLDGGYDVTQGLHKAARA
jgi:hypothetical protein